MAAKKKTAKAKAKKLKPNAGFRKVSTLKKAEIKKLAIEDLWVIEPYEKRPIAVRLCGCRNVCLA